MLTKDDLTHTVTLIKGYEDTICHTGTGFFLFYKNNYHIISNKHILNKCNKFDFPIPIIDKSNGEKLLLKCKITISPCCHKNYDVAVIGINDIISGYDSEKYLLDIKWITNDDILNSENKNIFTDIEDTLMLGYPYEIRGDERCCPIVKRGITASSIFSDYDGRKEFLTDAMSFNGSSGSPIFIENDSRYYLAGIHRGSLYDNENVNIGFGIAIKSCILLELFEKQY